MKSYDDEIKIICKFIRNYVNESKSKGIVIGLSGGLDSAVVAVLAKKALGAMHVDCLYLPYGSKRQDINKNHIKLLCKKFGLLLSCEKINIKSAVDAVYFCSEYQNGEMEKLLAGNIKARMRMIMLYHIAKMRNCLVIGTTNRSEYMLGYFTKWGDGACDLEPILHLYKTEIFELAKYLGIPEEIINKKPSADLWEGQTDEGEIGMSYDKLDKILQYINVYDQWVKEGKWDGTAKNEVYPTKYGLAIGEINIVRDMIKQSEHKRKSIPCLERN